MQFVFTFIKIFSFWILFFWKGKRSFKLFLSKDWKENSTLYYIIIIFFFTNLYYFEYTFAKNILTSGIFLLGFLRFQSNLFSKKLKKKSYKIYS